MYLQIKLIFYIKFAAASSRLETFGRLYSASAISGFDLCKAARVRVMMLSLVVSLYIQKSKGGPEGKAPSSKANKARTHSPAFLPILMLYTHINTLQSLHKREMGLSHQAFNFISGSTLDVCIYIQMQKRQSGIHVTYRLLRLAKTTFSRRYIYNCLLFIRL